MPNTPIRDPRNIPTARPAGPLAAVIAACGALALAPAFGQAPPQNVHWNVALASDGPVKAGSDQTLTISGAIDEGWHVYGLVQLPDGPTPLRVRLDSNDTVTAAGDPVESPPEKIHDARFGLDTQFHTHALTVRLPVHVGAQASGSRVIPVSVRFQLCSEHECQPPRTVHLTAPVDVAANG